jgi:predicted lactoylglutathione lyase
VPLDELDEVYKNVQEAGGECIEPPNRVLLENYGYIHAFAARDLDGNLMEFVSLPSREEILEFRQNGGGA